MNSSSSFFTCIYVKAGNLLCKRYELDVMINLHKPDVLCATEFAPKSTNTSVQESELQICGYELCSIS